MKLRKPIWKVSSSRLELGATVAPGPRLASAAGRFLERDLALEDAIAGEIDDPEAAFADQADDLELVQARADGKGIRAERGLRSSPGRLSGYRAIVVRRLCHAVPEGSMSELFFRNSVYAPLVDPGTAKKARRRVLGPCARIRCRRAERDQGVHGRAGALPRAHA